METQKKADENQEVMIEKKKSKAGLIVGLAIAVVAIIAIIVTIIVVANGPTSKANKALDLGKRYFDDMDYEKALAEFAEALEIDPNNKDIKAAVDDYISELVDMGYEYIEDEEYDEAVDIANTILEYFPDNKEAKKMLKEAEETDESDDTADDINEVDEDDTNNDENDDTSEVESTEPVGKAPIIYYNYYLYEGGFCLEDFVDVEYEEFEKNYDPFLFFVWGEDEEDGKIEYLAYTCNELPCSHPDEMSDTATWISYKDYEVTYSVTDSDNNTTSATLLIHYENSPGQSGNGWNAMAYHSTHFEGVLDGEAVLYDEY